MTRLTLLIALTSTLVAACAAPPTSTATPSPDTPGWTGRTSVIGTSSTIGGDAQATYWSQKWGIGRHE